MVKSRDPNCICAAELAAVCFISSSRHLQSGWDGEWFFWASVVCFLHPKCVFPVLCYVGSGERMWILTAYLFLVALNLADQHRHMYCSCGQLLVPFLFIGTPWEHLIFKVFLFEGEYMLVRNVHYFWANYSWVHLPVLTWKPGGPESCKFFFPDFSGALDFAGNPLLLWLPKMSLTSFLSGIFLIISFQCSFPQSVDYVSPLLSNFAEYLCLMTPFKYSCVLHFQYLLASWVPALHIRYLSAWPTKFNMSRSNPTFFLLNFYVHFNFPTSSFFPPSPPSSFLSFLSEENQASLVLLKPESQAKESGAVCFLYYCSVTSACSLYFNLILTASLWGF